jgi:hypothetical protein
VSRHLWVGLHDRVRKCSSRETFDASGIERRKEVSVMEYTAGRSMKSASKTTKRGKLSRLKLRDEISPIFSMVLEAHCKDVL